MTWGPNMPFAACRAAVIQSGGEFISLHSRKCVDEFIAGSDLSREELDEMFSCQTRSRSIHVPVLLTLLATLASGGCTTLHDSPWAGHIARHPERCPNVSVIFVEATPDIGNWGNLGQLSGRFHRCGIRTCYFDPSVHGDAKVLASWIEHEKSRGQRVLLVGWSYGVVQALDAVKLLESRHVSVDTLVSIDCFWLNWHRGDDLQPSNADRVVLIYRDQARLPEGFCNPVVHRIDTYRHLTVAGHRHTVDVLFQETIRLGGCEQSKTPFSSTEQLASVNK